MTDTTLNRNLTNRLWSGIIFYAMLLTSLAFWTGAIILAMNALQLTDKAGYFAKAQLWQAAVFALGMAAGIAGATIELYLKSKPLKALGMSGILLGFTFISLSFVMGWSIDQSTANQYVAIPFLIPSALLLLSIITFLNAFRADDSQDESTNEELQ